MLVGFHLLLLDSDIFVGFLWVIDLGVGLIFFIFMLHFSPFMNQKTKLNLATKSIAHYNLYFFFFYIFIYFFAFNVDNNINSDLNKFWFFNISYLDYYNILKSFEVSELSLLREMYFLVTSLIFYIINFSLLYGLIVAILLVFSISRIFSFLYYSQIKNVKMLRKLSSNFFIRSQDFIKQSNAPAIVDYWYRKSSVKKS